MTIDDIINYGDSLLAIGKTRGSADPRPRRRQRGECAALRAGPIKLGLGRHGCACPGSALECPEHD